MNKSNKRVTDVGTKVTFKSYFPKEDAKRIGHVIMAVNGIAIVKEERTGNVLRSLVSDLAKVK